MQMLAPCCQTSLLPFKYMSVSSNESDMRAQAKANAMTLKSKSLVLIPKMSHSFIQNRW